MEKVLKPLTILLLAVIAGALIYLTYRGIAGREEFKNEVSRREVFIKKSLKQILKIQEAYENRYNRFATSEELQNFLLTDSVYAVKKYGEYTSEMAEAGKSEADLAIEGNKLYKKGLSIDEIVAKNLLVRDTVWSPARTIFSEDKAMAKLDDQALVKSIFTVRNYNKLPEDSLWIKIDTATMQNIVGPDTIYRSVFQAEMPCRIYLSDLDAILLKDKINTLEERSEGKGFAGLRLGSLKEFKTTGDWE